MWRRFISKEHHLKLWSSLLHCFLLLSGISIKGLRSRVWIRDQSKMPLETPMNPHLACLWIDILHPHRLTVLKSNWNSRTRTNGQTISWRVWRDGWRPMKQAVPRAILSTRMMRIIVGLMGSAAFISISSSVIPTIDKRTMAKSSWFHLTDTERKDKIIKNHTWTDTQE